MTTDEMARLHLRGHASRTWDDRAAEALMSALPVNADVLVTEQELDRRLKVTELRLGAAIHRSVVTTLFGVFSLNLSVAAVIAIGVQLAS